jgi:hypothetical protein
MKDVSSTNDKNFPNLVRELCHTGGKDTRKRISDILDRTECREWHDILREARGHHLTPLLAEYATEAPQWARQELVREYASVAMHNRSACSVLSEIAEKFAEEGICFLLWKGLATAATCYPNIDARASGDLDLLVLPDTWVRAADVLVSLGFGSELSGNEQAMLSSIGHHCVPFQRSGCRVIVELHWRFTPIYFPFDLPLRQAWKRSVSTWIAGTKIQVLGSEDDLVSACVHGAKHGWSYLSSVLDIAFIIFNRKPDWYVVGEVATCTASTRMVNTGLLLAIELLGVELPPHVEELVRSDKAATSIAQTAKEKIVAGKGSGRIDIALTSLRSFRGLKNKINVLSQIWRPTQRDLIFNKLGLPWGAFVPLRLLNIGKKLVGGA